MLIRNSLRDVFEIIQKGFLKDIEKYDSFEFKCCVLLSVSSERRVNRLDRNVGGHNILVPDRTLSN